MGCIKTEERSGIIDCSLVPGEVEVVTVQSLQAQIYQYADAPSSSVPPPLPSLPPPPPPPAAADLLPVFLSFLSRLPTVLSNASSLPL